MSEGSGGRLSRLSAIPKIGLLVLFLGDLMIKPWNATHFVFNLGTAYVVSESPKK